MTDPNNTVYEKVSAILRPAGKSTAGSSNLSESTAGSSTFAADAKTVDLIAAVFRSTYSAEVARDIGFHLTDWNLDAAFLTALHLYPDRFSPEEIEIGIKNLIVHAPNHLAAAAKLAGHPVADVFGVEALGSRSANPGA